MWRYGVGISRLDGRERFGCKILLVVGLDRDKRRAGAKRLACHIRRRRVWERAVRRVWRRLVR